MTIKSGSILIEGALVPGSMRPQTERCSNGWMLVTGLDRPTLRLRLLEAGWDFFWTAGEVRIRAFGFDREKTMRKALQRILARPESERTNCAEITAVTLNRFAGMPYVSVSATFGMFRKMFVAASRRMAS